MKVLKKASLSERIAHPWNRERGAGVSGGGGRQAHTVTPERDLQPCPLSVHPLDVVGSELEQSPVSRGVAVVH